MNCNISKTARRRKLKFGENIFQAFLNILVNSEKVDLNYISNSEEVLEKS